MASTRMNFVLFMVSASVECYATGVLHECGIVCSMCSPQARNCMLYVISASAECALYVVSASDELCVVCGLRGRGIVCCMWSPRARNCVLYVVSASAECHCIVFLRAQNCNVTSAGAELCASTWLPPHVRNIRS